MSTALWVLGVLAYFAVGVGIARLRARQMMRTRYRGDDVRVEMLGLMFAWPILAPIYLLVALVRLVLFPRSLR